MDEERGFPLPSCSAAIVGAIFIFTGLPLVGFAIIGGSMLVRFLANKELEWREERAVRKAVASVELDDRLRLARAIIRLGVLMAAADGVVEAAEIAVIRRFFLRHGAPPEMMLWVDHQLAEATKGFSVDAVLAEVNRIADREDRIVVMMVLAEIMAADGAIDPAELAALYHLGAGLGFGPDEIPRILGIEDEDSGPGEDRVAAALRELGLEAGASLAEAKRAYRKLAQKYHPDKVANLGPGVAEAAGERMRRINAAWATIQEAMG